MFCTVRVEPGCLQLTLHQLIAFTIRYACDFQNWKTSRKCTCDEKLQQFAAVVCAATVHFILNLHKMKRFSLDILRARDDMIHTELRKVETPKSKELDPDLPGMGQFYCLHCDRHFTNTTIRDEHYKTKKHRRRVKLMEGPAPHNQIDAEVAAGMGTPDNGPKLRVGEDFALDM